MASTFFENVVLTMNIYIASIYYQTTMNIKFIVLYFIVLFTMYIYWISAIHSGFLEHWNSQKSLCNIWQRFSCLLDEGIPKICKKLSSHGGFLSYLPNSTANSAHLAAHFCPVLVCPQKATVRIQFLPCFWNPLIK